MIQRIRDGIRDFYPGYFALVMATGIVSLSSYFQGMELIAWALFIINVPIYMVDFGVCVLGCLEEEIEPMRSARPAPQLAAA